MRVLLAAGFVAVILLLTVGVAARGAATVMVGRIGGAQEVPVGDFYHFRAICISASHGQSKMMRRMAWQQAPSFKIGTMITAVEQRAFQGEVTSWSGSDFVVDLGSGCVVDVHDGKGLLSKQRKLYDDFDDQYGSTAQNRFRYLKGQGKLRITRLDPNDEEVHLELLEWKPVCLGITRIGC